MRSHLENAEKIWSSRITFISWASPPIKKMFSPHNGAFGTVHFYRRIVHSAIEVSKLLIFNRLTLKLAQPLHRALRRRSIDSSREGRAKVEMALGVDGRMRKRRGGKKGNTESEERDNKRSNNSCLLLSGEYLVPDEYRSRRWLTPKSHVWDRWIPTRNELYRCLRQERYRSSSSRYFRRANTFYRHCRLFYLLPDINASLLYSARVTRLRDIAEIWFKLERSYAQGKVDGLCMSLFFV